MNLKVYYAGLPFSQGWDPKTDASWPDDAHAILAVATEYEDPPAWIAESGDNGPFEDLGGGEFRGRWLGPLTVSETDWPDLLNTRRNAHYVNAAGELVHDETLYPDGNDGFDGTPGLGALNSGAEYAARVIGSNNQPRTHKLLSAQDHGDVDDSTPPATGQVLTFDGDKWGPAAPTGGTPTAHASTHLPGGSDPIDLLDAQILCEQTFDRLLQGRLTDGGAATIAYTFGAAPSNNSVGTWGGSGWSLAAGYRATNTATDTFTFVVNLPYQGAVTFDRGTAALLRSSTVQIAVDGGAPITWDQNAERTKATAALAAGPHSIVVTAHGADALTCCSLAGVSYGGYAYAGQGTAGDEAKVVHLPAWLFAHSLGIGANVSGGVYTAGTGTNYCTDYAPALTPFLPMGSTDNSSTLTRDAVASTNQPVTRRSLNFFGVTGYHPLLAGQSLTLSSTAGTRGYRIQPYGYGQQCEDVNSTIHENVLAALVRVTTPAAGSNFAENELALFVLNLSRSTASTVCNVLFADMAAIAGDLFKIPADLL